MQLNLINKQNIQNKKVLVRVDFNVPLEEKDGKLIVADDTRIQNAIRTIKFLLENNAQVILLSHLGRPKGKDDTKYSLAPIAKHLEKLINQPVAFSTLDEALVNSPRDKLTLIENLRFYPGEKKNDPDFAQKLASLADIYINESFSACHRAHASVEAITKLLPSFAGFALNEEIRYLAELIEDPARPFVVIVGGAKISDKVSAIKKLSQVADTILVGGGVSNNFLKAEGFDVANSYLQDTPADQSKNEINFVQFADDLLDENKQEHTLINDVFPLPKIIYPIDVIASKSIEDKNSQTINLLDPKNKDVADELMFLDIGPKTIKLFTQVIDQAKTIFWNGPMGVFEKDQFNTGTKKIAQAISSSSAKSILGGGDTIRAIDDLGLEKDFTYISTAGGASLEFLSGNDLPGILPLIK